MNIISFSIAIVKKLYFINTVGKFSADFFPLQLFIPILDWQKSSFFSFSFSFIFLSPLVQITSLLMDGF